MTPSVGRSGKSCTPPPPFCKGLDYKRAGSCGNPAVPDSCAMCRSCLWKPKAAGPQCRAITHGLKHSRLPHRGHTRTPRATPPEKPPRVKRNLPGLVQPAKGERGGRKEKKRKLASPGHQEPCPSPPPAPRFPPSVPGLRIPVTGDAVSGLDDLERLQSLPPLPSPSLRRGVKFLKSLGDLLEGLRAQPGGREEGGRRRGGGREMCKSSFVCSSTSCSL